jgi:hypothetical protein
MNYKQMSDSPWAAQSSLIVEDFEDGLLNIAGVTASAGSIRLPGTHTDSVDGDDGAVDGIGAGHSWALNTSEAGAGVTFLFDAGILGSLPTLAGFVWTDGSEVANVTIEFLDADMNILSTQTAVLGDGIHTSNTNADRFFGFESASGIAGIHISADAGGLELDHLQIGFSEIPAPATLALLGIAGLSARRRRSRA